MYAIRSYYGVVSASIRQGIPMAVSVVDPEGNVLHEAQ